MDDGSDVTDEIIKMGEIKRLGSKTNKYNKRISAILENDTYNKIHNII